MKSIMHKVFFLLGSLKLWTAIVVAFEIALTLATVVLWDWLREEGESPSAVIRNVFLVGAAPIALLLAVWRSIVGTRQAETAQQQAQTAQHSLLNERYQRGAEMLGHGYRSVRLAGIYALDRLAREYPEEYHLQIMQVFCAFVRHPTRSRQSENTDGRLRDDVQAVMEAIGSRGSPSVAIERRAELRVNLRGADLKGAQILDADLSQSFFQHSKLSDAWLARVDLTAAYFDYADLSRTQFYDTDLGRARLQSANLSGAMLQGIQMSKVSLHNANLAGANLGRANLSEGTFQDTIATNVWFERANLSQVTFLRADLSQSLLIRADLSGAEFLGANLTGAKLSEANLTGVIFSGDGMQPTRGLTQAQLDEALADPSSPPKLDGVLDAETSKQLVWNGRSPQSS